MNQVGIFVISTAPPELNGGEALIDPLLPQCPEGVG